MKHQTKAKRKAEVIRIWEERYPNVTVEEVARIVNLCERTIYRYLNEASQPLPPRKPRRKMDMNKVRRAHELFKIHENKAKVARIMKMSRVQIDTYLKMNPNE